VFENSVLTKIFGAKRDQVTDDWRKIHNKELHELYSSQNIVPLIKSIIVTWAMWHIWGGDRSRQGFGGET
jgi:hypothetical protein